VRASSPRPVLAMRPSEIATSCVSLASPLVEIDAWERGAQPGPRSATRSPAIKVNSLSAASFAKSGRRTCTNAVSIVLVALTPSPLSTFTAALPSAPSVNRPATSNVSYFDVEPVCCRRSTSSKRPLTSAFASGQRYHASYAGSSSAAPAFGSAGATRLQSTSSTAVTLNAEPGGESESTKLRAPGRDAMIHSRGFFAGKRSPISSTVSFGCAKVTRISTSMSASSGLLNVTRATGNVPTNDVRCTELGAPMSRSGFATCPPVEPHAVTTPTRYWPFFAIRFVATKYVCLPPAGAGRP
jgi:hypothetical protein